MTITIQRPDGSEQAVRGYKFRAPHVEARHYDGSSAPDALPKKVDLRPHMTAVEDQKQTNSCAANATAGAYEYLVKRHTGEPYDVSRMFIYYNGRYQDADQNDSDIEDGGMTISGAIDGLKQYGACSEETWPFEEGAVNDEPEEGAYTEAADFLIEDVALVPTDLGRWKQALAEGYPIIFGIKLFDSFDKQRQPGLVPAPSAQEQGRKAHGGHAMLCVGYSDPDQLFIVRNSWGSGWGDNGYCYIPYSYLLDPQLNFGDSWFIRRAEGVAADDETWSDDDESVIEELDTLLAEMSDEDYAELVDAMGDVPFETRLALIFLAAAGADGEIADEELDEVATYLGTVLEAIASRYKPKKVLKHALKRLDDEALLEESIALLGEHLPNEALASIVQHVKEVVDTDETSEEEESFIDELVQAWQVE